VPLTPDYKNDTESMLNAITSDTKMIILCNPGNPSSTITTEKELDSFMEKVPEDCLVVLDEAYAEFCTSYDYPDSFKYLKSERNMIILRTFSKFYSLAGLRIGYAIAPTHIIEVLKRVVAPFAANSIAQAAAIAAMDDTEHQNKVLVLLKEAKEYLRKELAEFGFDAAESHTNFLFINTHLENVKELVDSLFKQGIMISGPTGGKYPHHIRITIGTMDQNYKLINAIKHFMEK